MSNDNFNFQYVEYFWKIKVTRSVSDQVILNYQIGQQNLK